MNTRILLFLSLCTPMLMCASQTVVDTAATMGHTAFAQAVKDAGLYDHAQKQEGEDGSIAPFTVLVPSNKAFDALGDLDAKTKKKLVMFHVVPGQKIKAATAFGDGVPTVGEHLVMGDDTTLHLEESEKKATITGGPHEASNGVIYELDAVLMTTPPAPAAPTTVDHAGPEPASTPSSKTQTATLPCKNTQRHPDTGSGAGMTIPAKSPQSVVQDLADQTTHSSTLEQMHSLQNSVSQLTQTMQLLIHVLQEQVVVEQQPAVSLATPGLPQAQPLRHVQQVLPTSYAPVAHTAQPTIIVR